ncbi:pyridoxamine 5'-phosphate oxidase family protein [Paenibacillus aurantius]|uniref:Pyridoxamine 5'-phosphate oxidase family protein n=1 Tax=Paenibacillus aurantius TaxID=2918900 RepID=A0AA96LE47_9BACL|nr:pyridoxamine 5'-phosphate oxidase family protein [Paenibacillus aurantius]WNQ12112.1 pyridoxamine 5'-phosphate oxidase family protein [Paenibacillus aurantius]
MAAMEMLWKEEVGNGISALVNEATTIMVSSVDEHGYPNTKQMFKMKHDGLETFWFSTNTSSMRVKQFQRNPHASLYFVGKSNGLMLVGDMKVRQDRDSKEWLWVEGSEKYYPLGVEDPDYCVLEFVAKTANYYGSLQKYIFDIKEWKPYALSILR